MLEEDSEARKIRSEETVQCFHADTGLMGWRMS